MTLKSNKKSRGFTLIESLVALVILAVLGSTAYSSNEFALSNTNKIRIKSVAVLISQNKASELKIQARHKVSMGLNDTEVTQGGYEWKVSTSIEKATSSLTRLNIEIFLKNAPKSPVHTSKIYIATGLIQ